MGRLIDLTGQKFGRLLVIERAGSDKSKNATWLCACDCGNCIIVCRPHLRRGATVSCGCHRKAQNITARITHGGRKERLYTVWANMHARCGHESRPDYKHYGGRGITVCAEWKNYGNFRSWALANGYDENAPFGECTIDRIDVNGNYEPTNCRWVDMAEQSRNKRTTRKKEG